MTGTDLRRTSSFRRRMLRGELYFLLFLTFLRFQPLATYLGSYFVDSSSFLLNKHLRNLSHVLRVEQGRLRSIGLSTTLVPGFPRGRIVQQPSGMTGNKVLSIFLCDGRELVGAFLNKTETSYQACPSASTGWTFNEAFVRERSWLHTSEACSNRRSWSTVQRSRIGLTRS